MIAEFKSYQRKIGDRTELYHTVAKTFNVQRALYPGSHVDIAPSFVIPELIYVDNFKGAIRFFQQIEEIHSFIERKKWYEAPCTITFLAQDYYDELDIEPVDLIISQYAGFVGQATSRYLKSGGILLCNDSHGDATLARFDETFTFIGVIKEDNQIIQTKLDEYFTLAKGRAVDLEKVKKKMRGLPYTKQVENYIFQKKR